MDADIDMPLPGPGRLSRQLTGVGDVIDDSPAMDVPMPDAAATAAAAGHAGSVGAAGAAAGEADAAAAADSPAVWKGTPLFHCVAAGTTDPGVAGKVNQDSYFIVDPDAEGNMALGVLDGHGRELGKLAADAARDSMVAFLNTAGAYDRIRANPEAEIVHMFDAAHTAVNQAFREYYTEREWTVKMCAEGYLVRQRQAGQPWTCVHGGTTATVVIILRGRWVVVGNVGDSTALLFGTSFHSAVHPIHLWGARSVTSLANPPMLNRTAWTQLSSDHSPENVSEFYRMREARPCPHREHQPELLFVYDTLSSSKLACPPVYNVTRTGEASATNRGVYYKNVRDEWATLVAVPPYARYQDALAFTRSVGDFHLHSYGVSHRPDVVWMDLGAASTPHAAVSAASNMEEDGKSGDHQWPALAICLCSDGVWDNWKYHDASGFLLKPAFNTSAHLDSKEIMVVTPGSHMEQTHRAAEQFMAANLKRGQTHFGSQADNMTAIVCYLIPQDTKSPAK